MASCFMMLLVDLGRGRWPSERSCWGSSPEGSRGSVGFVLQGGSVAVSVLEQRGFQRCDHVKDEQARVVIRVEMPRREERGNRQGRGRHSRSASIR